MGRAATARLHTTHPVKAPTHLRDLVADPQNRRQHTPRNIGMIVDALGKVGAARSIVIDEDNVVLAGNGVLDAAAEAGLTKVHVVEADGQTVIAVRRRGLSPTQKRDLAIYDNRAAELATWNLDQLRADLDAGEDLSAFFQPDELSGLLSETPAPGHTEPDAIPEPRPTTIKVGDLFQLGRHRLLCGDSTEAKDVARLMEDARAGLMNTDPPYGISYQNEDLHPNAGPIRSKIQNDDQASGAALQGFLEAAFRQAKDRALAPRAAWYLWHAMLTQGFFAAAAAAAVILHRQIVWVKPVLVFGRGQYHWKHELCFMGWVDGHQPPDYGRGNGERDQTTVWEIDGVAQAERKAFQHATPKPVALFAIPIRKHLRMGEVCYEPFAGTGPQFIAAEQASVACYGLELEPRFCQVILDRWEAFTSQTAVRRGRA